MAYEQKFGSPVSKNLITENNEKAKVEIKEVPSFKDFKSKMNEPKAVSGEVLDIYDHPMFEGKKKQKKYFNDRPKDLGVLGNIKYNINAPHDPNFKGGTIGAVSWLTSGAGLANLGTKTLKMYNKANKIPKIKKGFALAKKVDVPTAARATGLIGMTSKLSGKLASYFNK